MNPHMLVFTVPSLTVEGGPPIPRPAQTISQNNTANREDTWFLDVSFGRVWDDRGRQDLLAAKAGERLNRVAEGPVLGHVGAGILVDEVAHSVDKELDVLNGAARGDLLVKVRVESHLLHVLGCTHLNKGLTGRVGAVEELLEQVEHGIGRAVQAIIGGEVGVLDLHLGGEHCAALGELHDGLGGHAARLGREVDALARALGHVAGGITDERSAVAHALGAIVLGDGVRLDLDDLAALDLLASALADGSLVLLDGRAVHDSTGADANMVVLGEHPAVEVGGHVVTDVHLGEVLIEGHLLVVDLDALLEGDGVVVFAGLHGLGNTRVCAVGTDDDVNLELLWRAGLLAVVVGVLDRVGGGGVRVIRDHDVSHEAVDALGTELHSAVAEVGVDNLAPVGFRGSVSISGSG
jgi:hypothetical protein